MCSCHAPLALLIPDQLSLCRRASQASHYAARPRTTPHDSVTAVAATRASSSLLPPPPSPPPPSPPPLCVLCSIHLIMLLSAYPKVPDIRRMLRYHLAQYTAAVRARVGVWGGRGMRGGGGGQGVGGGGRECWGGGHQGGREALAPPSPLHAPARLRATCPRHVRLPSVPRCHTSHAHPLPARLLAQRLLACWLPPTGGAAGWGDEAELQGAGQASLVARRGWVRCACDKDG